MMLGGLIIFSLLLVVAKATVGDGSYSILSNSLWEIGGAIGIGLAVGLPAAALTGRLQDGEPIQAEALGIVFLCAGLAIWLEVSFLLAGMIAGATVVNLAEHHNRPFHEIEHIEWPFMILFFVLAGASFHLASLQLIGVVGLTYIVLRTFSRIAGGWVGWTTGWHAETASKLDWRRFDPAGRRSTWDGADCRQLPAAD